MKKTNFFKTLALVALMLIAANAWGQTTFIAGTGTANYTLPSDWVKEGTVEGGSYVKFSNGTLTSPLLDPHTEVSFVYTVATFGEGTNHPLTVRILNSANDIIETFTTATPSSSTYINTDSPLSLGSYTEPFKIQLYGPASKGVRLRNYSIKGMPIEVECTNSVTITKDTETNGTFTLSDNEVCADNDGGSVTISNILPAEGYRFKEITATVGTIDNNNKKVTAITANSTIGVVFEALPTYTLTWDVNGTTTTTTLPEGAAIGTTMPADPASCDTEIYTNFVGWTTTPLTSIVTTPPTFISSTTIPTADTTYYAVFGDGVNATVTFDVKAIAAANGWTNDTQYSSYTIDPITITYEGGGNNGKYYTTNNSWRVYNGGKVIVTSDDVVIFGVASNPNADFTRTSNQEWLFTSTATIQFSEYVISINSSTGFLTSCAVLAEPRINIIGLPDNKIDFGKTNLIDGEYTQDFYVSGLNLENDITLSMFDQEETSFTVSPTTITPTNGTVTSTKVTVTYKPTEENESYNIIEIVSGDIEFDVELFGAAILPTLSAPIATYASDITTNSFTANWDVVDNATSYQVNVWSQGNGSEEKPYNVLDLRTNSLSGQATVIGYVVGTATGSVSGNSLEGYVTFDGTFVKTNLVLADSPSETDGSKLIAVQLSSGSIRDALNIVDNPENQGKLITVTGSLENYFGNNPGVKNLTSYNLDATIPVINGSPFTTTDNSYMITGLEANKLYRYNVVAIADNYYNSTTSNAIQVQTESATGIGVCKPTTIQGVWFASNVIRNSTQVPLTVYNSLGKVIATSSTDINLSAMPNGIYVVKSANEVLKIVK